MAREDTYGNTGGQGRQRVFFAGVDDPDALQEEYLPLTPAMETHLRSSRRRLPSGAVMLVAACLLLTVFAVAVRADVPAFVFPLLIALDAAALLAVVGCVAYVILVTRAPRLHRVTAPARIETRKASPSSTDPNSQLNGSYDAPFLVVDRFAVELDKESLERARETLRHNLRVTVDSISGGRRMPEMWLEARDAAGTLLWRDSDYAKRLETREERTVAGKRG